MNRRGFFSKFGSAVAATAILTVPAAKADDSLLQQVKEDVDPNVPGYNRVFEGYRLLWTGWRGAWDTDALAAQWLAAPVGYNAKTWNRMDYGEYGPRPIAPFIAATHNGITGRYWPGQVFNIWEYTDRESRYVDIMSSQERRDRIKQLTLADMCRFIEKEG